MYYQHDSYFKYNLLGKNFNFATSISNKNIKRISLKHNIA